MICGACFLPECILPSLSSNSRSITWKILPSSASRSTSEDTNTPISWHFLLWAFDFICLVRFPEKKQKTYFGQYGFFGGGWFFFFHFASSAVTLIIWLWTRQRRPLSLPRPLSIANTPWHKANSSLTFLCCCTGVEEEVLAGLCDLSGVVQPEKTVGVHIWVWGDEKPRIAFSCDGATKKNGW